MQYTSTMSMKVFTCTLVLVLLHTISCDEYNSRTGALEQLLQQVHAKTARQDQLITDLKERVQQLTQSEGHLTDALTVAKRQAVQPVVAFFAIRDANATKLHNYQTFVFDQVRVNVNGSYNSTSGKFVCPYTGLYEFASTIVSAGETHNLNFQMMLDYVELAYLHATLYEYDMGTQVVVTHCNQGQHVFVRQAHKHNSMHFDVPGGFSTFSGHLIHMY